VWLTVFVTLAMLWLLAISVFTGGGVMSEESLRLISSPARALSFSAGDRLDAGAVQTVQWTPTRVLWLVPFAAATGVYLIACAMALGMRHPVRWAGAIVLAVYLVAGLGQQVHARWAATTPGRLSQSVFDGRYGLDALLTASSISVRGKSWSMKRARKPKVPMDDRVEVGAFADADEGRPDEPLYFETHRVRSGLQRITVTLPRAPVRAGIDPRRLLIDVNGNDNLRAVE
jgi:hypothetical protein